MMVVFFIGIGAASILTGFAATSLQITIGLTLIGVFASIYHPVGIALVSENAATVGRDLGINGVFGNMGVALAAVTAGALIDLIGWRAAFIAPGAAAIATGLAYALSGKDRRRAAADRPDSAPPTEFRDGQSRVFIVLIFTTVAAGAIFNGTTIIMPKLFDLRLSGLGPTTSALTGLVTLVFVGAAFTQVLVGHLIDRYPLRTVFLLVAGLQVPLMVMATIAGGGWIVAAALTLMMAVFGIIPLNDTIVARYVGDEWRSRAFAVKYLLSLGVAAGIVPLIAWLHGRSGDFISLFTTLTGLAAVIVLAAAFLPGRRPQAQAA